MRVYPGLPSPAVEAIVTHEASRERYEGKAEFLLGRYEMAGNTGTYIDVPYHRFPAAADLAGVGLASLAGLAGIVAEAPARGHKPVDLGLDAAEVRGRAVLVLTGWSERFGTDAYWDLAPFLSPGSLDLLTGAGAALVGVDFWNVDDVADPARPAHTRLLEAGIPIVENLADLASLPRTGFRFTAAPPRIAGGASFPVRAFAEVEAGA